MNRTSHLPYTYRLQQGATLIVTMIFLLIVTVIAISSLTNVNLQTSMLSNTQRKQITFQEAESAVDRNAATNANSYFELSKGIQQVGCNITTAFGSTNYPPRNKKTDSDNTFSSRSEMLYRGRRSSEITGDSIRLCGSGGGCTGNTSATYVVEVIGTSAFKDSDLKTSIHQGFVFSASPALCDKE
jgi:Tfp pilus assembly protein PilX